MFENHCKMAKRYTKNLFAKLFCIFFLHLLSIILLEHFFSRKFQKNRVCTFRKFFLNWLVGLLGNRFDKTGPQILWDILTKRANHCTLVQLMPCYLTTFLMQKKLNNKTVICIFISNDLLKLYSALVILPDV